MDQESSWGEKRIPRKRVKFRGQTDDDCGWEHVDEKKIIS